jgi:hypothetical protein
VLTLEAPINSQDESVHEGRSASAPDDIEEHGIECTKRPIDWRQRSAKLAVKHFPLHIRFDQLGLNHSTLKDQLEAMTQQHPTEKV